MQRRRFSAIHKQVLVHSYKSCVSLTSSIIELVPKRSAVSCLNDYHPIALTTVIMKHVLKHINNIIPVGLDSHQFACRWNRSTEDPVSTALQSALTNLKHPNSYLRMLFVDFSLDFNTVIPDKLALKLNNLGLSTSLYHRIRDFLSDRPWVVRVGSWTSSTLILNTGTPQGCVLSPTLFTLFTHDCSATHFINSCGVCG